MTRSHTDATPFFAVGRDINHVSIGVEYFKGTDGRLVGTDFCSVFDVPLGDRRAPLATAAPTRYQVINDYSKVNELVAFFEGRPHSIRWMLQESDVIHAITQVQALTTRSVSDELPFKGH
jgi:hypothetical protein